MGIVTGIVTAIHVLVSLALTALILLHAGRGGGLSEAFGGGFAPSSLSGSTMAERNLDRITVIVGVLFGITTVALVLLMA